MATELSERQQDPALGDKAYDYVSDEINRPALVSDLEQIVDGDVRFDSYTRQLYATDASAYEVPPIGVVMPTSTEDVAAVVSYCAENEIPVLPRGGGTSLAGQTVNEAVVLDFTKHMDTLLDIDPSTKRATAEVGVRLGELNQAISSHGLKFAPDPAWGDRSALGGAIGNNSTGSHSLKYGKTDYYIEEVEAVLADGTVTTFGEITVEALREEADEDASELLPRIYAEVVRILDEEATEVRDRYPDLKRNVSGYNLDMLVDEAAGKRRLPDNSGLDPDSEPGTVNLARLLAGSEGTLALITEATISLEPVPETTSVALLTYSDILEALEDVAPILEHGPAAVEVMDDVLLELAAQTREFRDVVGLLPDETDSVLLVEFYAEDVEHGKQQVADLLADRVPSVTPDTKPSADAAKTTTQDQIAITAMEAHDEETKAKFWKMRKSGLPILLSRTSDAKHIAYIEDTAIPAENLPAFVAEFQDVLDAHDTFASYYAHAGPGVLHIRPLINTKTVDGLESYEQIADEVTDLVIKYGGSVSGEHGDGRARTQWNRKLYGDQLWDAFRQLKDAYDPDWILNPGNICGDHDITENLRFSPSYEFDSGFDPALNWDNENGYQGMVELCHGCGGCRGAQETVGGVMCPTYRASQEEIQATRGRANMLRQAMSGSLPEEELLSEEFATEVLDLCVGCKGCTKDCPSGVDMAKMKAEITHARHEEHGASFRDKLFANIDALSSLGSTFAPLANAATAVPGSRTIMEKTIGIAKDRSLPRFHRTTFVDWFESRGGATVAEATADRSVVLFPDTYTNYNHPDAGKAAVKVLEAANIHVRLPRDDLTSSGRPPYSKGFIDIARETASKNVASLSPLVADGYDIVVVEPSDAVMFQSDYLDLLSGDAVESVASNTYGVLEYIDTYRLDEQIAFDEDTAGQTSVTYHGHCHQKSTKKDHHAVGVLRRAGYSVDPLDSTCCGMAGSFGYEAEHREMSRAIGKILYDQVEKSSGELVVAPGASCRTQLHDNPDSDSEPPHPIETVAAVIKT